MGIIDQKIYSIRNISENNRGSVSLNNYLDDDIDEHKGSKDQKFPKVIIKLPSSDAQMIMSVFKWGFRYPIVAMNFDLAVNRAHKEFTQ